jgi:hypothetical protein
LLPCLGRALTGGLNKLNKHDDALLLEAADELQRLQSTAKGNIIDSLRDFVAEGGFHSHDRGARSYPRGRYVRAERAMRVIEYDDTKRLHPFCNACGWRKGGIDSWDGVRCKCGHAAPPMTPLTDDEIRAQRSAR